MTDETKADYPANTAQLPSNMQIDRVNPTNPVLKQTPPRVEKVPLAMYIALLTQED